MYQNKSVTVIVLAAGKGARAGFGENKLFHPLYGAPVLYHTLTAVSSIAYDQLIVAAAKEDFEQIAPLQAAFPFQLVEGGKERFDSVHNALKVATGELVLIHDGARPYLSQKSLTDCLDCILQHGSGICSLPATDTTAIIRNGAIQSVPKRTDVVTLQTPQGFYTHDILLAYEHAALTGKSYTDDSSVYADQIGTPYIYTGDRNNKKLTFAEDFETGIFLPIISGKGAGYGVDTHAFGKAQDYIILGGVKIPSSSGLVAHSDGDVLYHALADALLSAIGQRDIGYFFPDTSKETENMDSAKIVEKAMSFLNERYLLVNSVSVAIQAEHPKLAPHIEAIRKNIQKLTGTPLNCIGVTAGTCEHLGYVGQGLGITVHCVVVVD